MTVPGTERQRKFLNDLERCCIVKAILTKDEEGAINCRRMLLTTTHLTDNAKVVHLFTLGGYLFEAFDRTKDRTRSFEYLDESIMHHREVL
jgi:hypothetical protein